MKPVVIFGVGQIADVVYSLMVNDAGIDVAAFTCDAAYMPEQPTWQGLPVVAFEEVERHFPPASHDMFIAIGYQDLNAQRAIKVDAARGKGYALPGFLHPGAGLPRDCTYGDNCFLMDKVLIHPRVTIGHDVWVWSGAMIGHHSKIGDHCWITSTASICGVVNVGARCFFAANATVGNNVTIGAGCFLGANTLVTKDLEDDRVVIAKSSEVLRLNAQQFLRMSSFR